MKITALRAVVTEDDYDNGTVAILQKGFHRDGTPIEYWARFPRLFDHTDVRVIESLDHLQAVYEHLQNDSLRIIAIGEHVSVRPPTRAPRIEGAYASDTEVTVAVIDADGVPYADGYSDETLKADPIGTCRAMVALIFGRDVDALVVLSSSAGLTGKFNAHIWVRLERPVSMAAWADWTAELAADVAEDLEGVIDTSITAPGHLLYSCRPHFPGDPFQSRLIRLPHEDTVAIRDLRNFVVRRRQGKRAKKRKGAEALIPFPHEEFPKRKDKNRSRDSYTNEWVWACVGNGFNCEDQMVPEFQSIIQREFDRAVAEHGLDLKDTTLSSRKVRYMFKRARDKIGTPWDEEDADEGFDIDEGLPADDVHEAMRDTLLNLPEDGVFQITATTGVGKSRAALDFLYRHPNTAYASPNHELLDQIAKRFNDAMLDRWKGHPFDMPQAVVWQGKERLCAYTDMLKVARKARRDLCTDCALKDTCAYWRQFHHPKTTVRLVPTALLTTGGAVLKGIDNLIIDEDVTEVFKGSAHLSDLAELKDRPDERLEDIGIKVFRWKTNGGEAPTYAELEEALDRERALFPDVPRFDAYGDAEAAAETVADLISASRYDNAIVSFYRALVDAGPERYADDINGLTVYSVGKGRKKVWKANVAWLNEPKVDARRVVLMNAHANMTAVRAIFPEVIEHRFLALHDNATVTRVSSDKIKGASAELLNRMGETCPDDEDEAAKWIEEEDAAIERRWKFAQWLRAQPYKRILLCTRLKTELKLREEHPDLLDRVAIVHFGKLEGLDTFTFGDGAEVAGVDLDMLVIHGRQLLRPYAMEQAAREAHPSEDPILRVLERDKKTGEMVPARWYETRPVQVDGGPGKQFTLQRPHHPDPRVQAQVDHMCRDQLNQALGRGRTTRRTKHLQVVIWHDLATDAPTDHVATDHEMWARTGNVQLLSPSEVQRVMGYPAKKLREETDIEPDLRYWVREGQTKPFYAAFVVDGVEDYAKAIRQLQALGAIRIETVRGSTVEEHLAFEQVDLQAISAQIEARVGGQHVDNAGETTSGAKSG